MPNYPQQRRKLRHGQPVRHGNQAATRRNGTPVQVLDSDADSPLARTASTDTAAGDGRAAQPWAGSFANQIGRASCRERVCPYVYISVVSLTLKKNKTLTSTNI